MMEGFVQLLWAVGTLAVVGWICWVLNGGPVNETHIGDIGSER